MNKEAIELLERFCTKEYCPIASVESCSECKIFQALALLAKTCGWKLSDNGFCYIASCEGNPIIDLNYSEFEQQKDTEIINLKEQLIQLCRVFHSTDCICKWCNIAKERATALKGEPFSSGPVGAEQTWNEMIAGDLEKIKSRLSAVNNRFESGELTPQAECSRACLGIEPERRPRCKRCGKPLKVASPPPLVMYIACDCAEQPKASESLEVKGILVRGKQIHERWRDWYKGYLKEEMKVTAELFTSSLAKQEQRIIDYDKVLAFIDRLEEEKENMFQEWRKMRKKGSQLLAQLTAKDEENKEITQ